jgi:periplasmic divalent cation tolerance protein
MKLITLLLTCADEAEASAISKKLLKEKSAACVRQAAVYSEFLWKGTTEESNEVLLIIESVEEKFEEIERAVKELHSYETFVLTAYSVLRSSHGVEDWIEESIN